MKNILGLTNEEVNRKQKAGLKNEIIDTYSPTYARIILANIFSLINVIVFPLLIVLYGFQLYSEIFAFSFMLIINTVTGIFDQANNKRQLDKLKSEFTINALVIRDGLESLIPASEIVEGDVIKAVEGDSIIADGTVIESNYLQLDESALTGESNYVKKDSEDKVFSGSFVVTGDCYYRVEQVGKNNLLNRIGTQSLAFKDTKSTIQKFSQRLIFILVFVSILLSVFNFLATTGTHTIESRILSVTTIVSLIIPQTLIFIFSFTFSVSIIRLYKSGVLVQKGGSIEQLTKINTICFDKTGTITTNEMKIVDIQTYNVDLKKFGELYNTCKENLYGINKTQSLLNKYFGEYDKIDISDFFQIPFTSKEKFSLLSAKINQEKNLCHQTIVFGAPDKLLLLLDTKLKNEISRQVKIYEDKGLRVLLGLYRSSKTDFKIKSDEFSSIPKNFDSAIAFAIEEELNPSIGIIIENFKIQNIEVKIISGDSKNSLSKVIMKVGLDPEKILDLSEKSEITDDEILSATIFARAKPEDKLRIIQALKRSGKFVAMVGDGINDVLGIKAADVGIAMEKGAKIARESADIVLLNNDFSKLPKVFYEGDNIVFNLGITTKLFLAKSLFAVILSLFCTLNKDIIPFFPASLLIFSSVGSSLPGYVLVFTRQTVKNSKNFIREVLMSSFIAAIFFFLVEVVIWYQTQSMNFDFIRSNTILIIGALSMSLLYSVYLLWESKKLTDLRLSFYLYFVLMAIGIFQMILPVSSEDSTIVQSIILFFFVLASINIIYFVNAVLKPKTLLIKGLIILGSFIWYPLAGFFPFRAYYRVERVPIENALFAIGISLIRGLLLSVVLIVRKRYLDRSR